MGINTYLKDSGWTKRRFPREAVDATSGAIAGGVARMFVSPLDVIKIRFQVQLESHCAHASEFGASGGAKYTGVAQAFRDIVREEGVVGLWRGTVPAQLLVMPYVAIQFTAIHKFKTFVAGSANAEDHRKLSPVMSYVGGALAGTAGTIGSYPFDLVRTVLASQGEPKAYPNMRSAFVGIAQKRGLTGLYAGLAPTLVEIIPYSALQFGFYDSFKRVMAGGVNGGADATGGSSVTPLQQFVAGLAAGTLSRSICHPLDVVKKRFQVEGLQRHPRYGAIVEEKRYRSIVDCIQQIVRTEGVQGLYKGLLPSLLKAAPAAAITFAVYESVSGWLAAQVE